ncbi:MAG TPA: peptidylprolyl isomerase [Terriglobales bacterium]|nr:peptidylprolyl isomerase [Terriglobales bacterium]
MKRLALYCVLGGLLFGLDRLQSNPPVSPAMPPSLVSGLSAEERLVRQALALGLADTDPVIQQRLRQNSRFTGGIDDGLLEEMKTADPVVRRRLAQRVRLLIESESELEEPTEEEIAAAYASAPPRSEVRVRLTQIFFAGADSDEAMARAQWTWTALLAEARSGDHVAGLGDLFVEAVDLPALSQTQLARRFGETVASAALAQPLHQWSPPVVSAYGVHLLWVDKRTGGEPLSLAEAGPALRAQLVSQKRATAVETWLASVM